MWPESGAPSQKFVSHIDRGDSSTVSRWDLSAHTGTHADARMHFIPGGWTIDALELSRCVGPCRVVDLTHLEGHVGRADLETAGVAGTARLLLKTDRKSTRLNSSHANISYAVFCLKKKKIKI